MFGRPIVNSFLSTQQADDALMQLLYFPDAIRNEWKLLLNSTAIKVASQQAGEQSFGFDASYNFIEFIVSLQVS